MFINLKTKLSNNSLEIADIINPINILEKRYAELLKTEIEEIVDIGISRLLAYTAILDFFTYNVGGEKAQIEKLSPAVYKYLQNLAETCKYGINILEENYHRCYELEIKGLHTKSDLVPQLREYLKQADKKFVLTYIVEENRWHFLGMINETHHIVGFIDELEPLQEISKELKGKLPFELQNKHSSILTKIGKALNSQLMVAVISTQQKLDPSSLDSKISKDAIANIGLKPIYAHNLQAKICNQIHVFKFPEGIKEALRVAHRDENYQNEIQLLQKLADWCIQKESNIKNSKRKTEYLMKAGLFLNAALVIYRRKILKLGKTKYAARTITPFKELDAQEQKLISKIKKIEQQFLAKLNCTCTDWGQDLKLKASLESIRAEIGRMLQKVDGEYGTLKQNDSLEVRKGRAAWMREIYDYVAKEIKLLITQIIEGCVITLSNPPCSYAIIGLGSLAKEEMTPYSDLETAILIKKDTPETREYFYNLSVLLNFRLMNFGETAIPLDLLDTNFDEEVRPGLQLDLGGKSPLGRPDQDYELIQTPAGMAEYIKEEAFRRGKLLPIEMNTCTYICGDSKLTKKYKELINQELDALQQDIKLRESRSLKLLQQDLEKFDPNIGDFISEGKLYKVKEDLYRIPNTILDNLTLFYGLPANSSWERIDSLSKYGLLKEAAIYLTSVFSEVTGLRLRTYQHYRCQKENLSAIFSLEPIDQQTEAAYKLIAEQMESLMEVYKTLLPLREMIQDFIERQGKIEVLQKNKLYDSTPKTCGQIAARLCDYKRAAVFFRQAIEIDKEDAESWNILGAALLKLKEKQGVIKFFQQALSICEMRHGKDNVEVAKVLVNLGNAYGILGDVQHRKELLECALEIQEKFYGKNHVEVAITLVNLGNAYGDLGDAQHKKELLERALNIEEKFYGKDHVEVAITLTNLGNAYGKLGDAQYKKELLERALDIQKKFYGKDHVEVAKVLVNLGNAYGALGDIQHRKELLECALEIDEKFYGKDHIEVAITLGNLGTAYGDLGDAQHQKELLERALRILEKFYGKDHVEVAKVLVNLGNAYGALGDIQHRKELLERALRILEKFYGKDHVEITKTLGNLGNAYGDLGDAQHKKELLERALRILEKFYDKDHVEVATTLVNLGNAYGDLGDAQHKKELLECALDIQKKFYGKDNVEVATTLMNLGNAYGALGDVQHQKELLECALEIKEKFYGKDHVAVARTLMNLGNTHGALGDVQHQKELLERAREIQEKFYGKDHIVVTRTLTNLGNAYRALGDAKRSKNLLKCALEIKEKFYGKDHVEVAITRFNLGLACKDLSKIMQAKQHFEFAHKVFLDNFGSNHQYTQKANQALLTQKANQALLSLSDTTDNVINLQQVTSLLYQQGIQALTINDYTRAILNFSQLLGILYIISNKHPLIPEIQTYLAMAYMKKGSLDEAMATYENYLNSIKEQPVNDDKIDGVASACHNLGCLYCVRYRQQNKPQDKEQAEQCFNQAITLKPTGNKYTEYAHFLYQEQQFAKAIANLQIALKLDDTTELNYGNLEKPTLNTNLQEEIDQYGKIIIRANLLAYYLMIKCYDALKNTEKVEQYLKEFTTKVESSKNPLAYRLLGYIHNSLNNEDEAESCFGKALSLEPVQQQAPNNTAPHSTHFSEAPISTIAKQEKEQENYKYK